MILIPGKLYTSKKDEKIYLVPENPRKLFLPDQDDYFMYIEVDNSYKNPRYRFLYEDCVVFCNEHILDKIEPVK